MPYRKDRVKKLVGFTQKEWETVQQKAEKAGCRVGTYIRKISVEGEVKIYDLAVLTRLRRDINRIGTNINQVALVVNSQNYVYKNDIEELQIEVKKMLDAYDEAMEEFMGTKKPRGK